MLERTKNPTRKLIRVGNSIPLKSDPSRPGGTKNLDLFGDVVVNVRGCLCGVVGEKTGFVAYPPKTCSPCLCVHLALCQPRSLPLETCWADHREGEQNPGRTETSSERRERLSFPATP